MSERENSVRGSFKRRSDDTTNMSTDAGRGYDLGGRDRQEPAIDDERHRSNRGGTTSPEILPSVPDADVPFADECPFLRSRPNTADENGFGAEKSKNAGA